jgi:hypothetical protein
VLRLLCFDDWRHSVDVDFSGLPLFPSDGLRKHVERWFAQTEVVHGLTVHLLDSSVGTGFDFAAETLCFSEVGLQGSPKTIFTSYPLPFAHTPGKRILPPLA